VRHLWVHDGVHQYEELIDEMIKRAPASIIEALRAAREKGFDFSKLKENLKKAGAGLNTKIN